MRRLLALLRALRDHVPGLKAAHRAVREPYYRILELIFPRGVSVRLSSGHEVRLHPRFIGMGAEMYEEAPTGLMAAELKPGAIVLDIGAHVGLHTLMFSRCVGPTGRVIAIEPSPANAKLLREHLAWNSCYNVEVIEAAVGDEIGHVNFTFRSDPTDPGAFANSLAYDIGGKSSTIRMTTIDALCIDCAPDLIKIDVEGAELFVLRGARETLDRLAPTLMVAVHPEPMRMMGTTPSELISFLEVHSYEGHHLDGRRASDPGFEEIVIRKC
jgi:FkbM family methyltransferase